MGSASPDPAGAGAVPDVHDISREELQRRLREPSLVLVDVLPEAAYAAAHIPGAINLPLAELARRAPALIPDRAAEIAVYCAAFS
jgi:rhodanese-related sulfurtransferase